MTYMYETPILGNKLSMYFLIKMNYPVGPTLSLKYLSN